MVDPLLAKKAENKILATDRRKPRTSPRITARHHPAKCDKQG
jgi:hypothetical protein